jgi:hypothetical protein
MYTRRPVQARAPLKKPITAKIVQSLYKLPQYIDDDINAAVWMYADDAVATVGSRNEHRAI